MIKKNIPGVCLFSLRGKFYVLEAVLPRQKRLLLARPIKQTFGGLRKRPVKNENRNNNRKWRKWRKKNKKTKMDYTYKRWL